jgi:radical SAM protein with 4Fe4S-binding SPASM domain
VECTETQTRELTNVEFLKEFNKKAAQLRIPLSGNLALTHRCSVRCVHCYLGEEVSARENIHKELDTRQWKRIIDEITRAGCLYLLITGGEPLLRKDFKEIYRHAKTNGLVVTLFTNGMLIDDDILEFFQRFPPRAVEITIYGATPGTHERITGIKGSYEKTWAGINKLIRQKINVRLKTILMTLNRHEFFEMQNMAGELGVKFRFDAAVFPGLKGDKSPVKLRVPVEDAIEKEFSDENRRREWKDFFMKTRELPSQDYLYQCGAGMTHFHIDPYGNLKPCLMIADLDYNLVNGDFSTGWNQVMPRIRERKPGNDYQCNQCRKRALCGFCPAFFKLENDAEDICSQYLCIMGQQRFEKINEGLSVIP